MIEEIIVLLKVSGWIPLALAITMFMYQTLDAIDGKQARRTGSSNALGELFDHGCDSLSNRKKHYYVPKQSLGNKFKIEPKFV